MIIEPKTEEGSVWCWTCQWWQDLKNWVLWSSLNFKRWEEIIVPTVLSILHTANFVFLLYNFADYYLKLSEDPLQEDYVNLFMSGVWILVYVGINSYVEYIDREFWMPAARYTELGLNCSLFRDLDKQKSKTGYKWPYLYIVIKSEEEKKMENVEEKNIEQKRASRTKQHESDAMGMYEEAMTIKNEPIKMEFLEKLVGWFRFESKKKKASPLLLRTYIQCLFELLQLRYFPKITDLEFFYNKIQSSRVKPAVKSPQTENTGNPVAKLINLGSEKKLNDCRDKKSEDELKTPKNTPIAGDTTEFDPEDEKKVQPNPESMSSDAISRVDTELNETKQPILDTISNAELITGCNLLKKWVKCLFEYHKIAPLIDSTELLPSYLLYASTIVELIAFKKIGKDSPKELNDFNHFQAYYLADLAYTAMNARLDQVETLQEERRRNEEMLRERNEENPDEEPVLIEIAVDSTDSTDETDIFVKYEENKPQTREARTLSDVRSWWTNFYFLLKKWEKPELSAPLVKKAVQKRKVSHPLVYSNLYAESGSGNLVPTIHRDKYWSILYLCLAAITCTNVWFRLYHYYNTVPSIESVVEYSNNERKPENADEKWGEKIEEFKDNKEKITLFFSNPNQFVRLLSFGEVVISFYFMYFHSQKIAFLKVASSCAMYILEIWDAEPIERKLRMSYFYVKSYIFVMCCLYLMQISVFLLTPAVMLTLESNRNYKEFLVSTVLILAIHTISVSFFKFITRSPVDVLSFLLPPIISFDDLYSNLRPVKILSILQSFLCIISMSVLAFPTPIEEGSRFSFFTNTSWYIIYISISLQFFWYIWRYSVPFTEKFMNHPLYTIKFEENSYSELLEHGDGKIVKPIGDLFGYQLYRFQVKDKLKNNKPDQNSPVDYVKIDYEDPDFNFNSKLTPSLRVMIEAGSEQLQRFVTIKGTESFEGLLDNPDVNLLCYLLSAENFSRTYQRETVWMAFAIEQMDLDLTIDILLDCVGTNTFLEIEKYYVKEFNRIIRKEIVTLPPIPSVTTPGNTIINRDDQVVGEISARGVVLAPVSNKADKVLGKNEYIGYISEKWLHWNRTSAKAVDTKGWRVLDGTKQVIAAIDEHGLLRKVSNGKIMEIAHNVCERKLDHDIPPEKLEFSEQISFFRKKAKNFLWSKTKTLYGTLDSMTNPSILYPSQRTMVRALLAVVQSKPSEKCVSKAEFKRRHKKFLGKYPRISGMFGMIDEENLKSFLQCFHTTDKESLGKLLNNQFSDPTDEMPSEYHYSCTSVSESIQFLISKYQYTIPAFLDSSSFVYSKDELKEHSTEQELDTIDELKEAKQTNQFKDDHLHLRVKYRNLRRAFIRSPSLPVRLFRFITIYPSYWNHLKKDISSSKTFIQRYKCSFGAIQKSRNRVKDEKAKKDDEKFRKEHGMKVPKKSRIPIRLWAKKKKQKKRSKYGTRKLDKSIKKKRKRRNTISGE